MKNKFQKANEKLPLDWIPIGVLVRHAFPREFDIRYGKSVIAEDSNYFSLEEIENKIRDRYYAPEKILVAFADMIIFDALIGNMDRHHDNWGILEHMLVKSGQTSIDPKELVSKIRFATLFDHGSSLLFELEEDTVERYLLDPELFKQKYTLGTNYTFFLNQNRGSENIFSLIKWYIDNTIDWKKRFKDSIRKMLDGINNYDFSKLLVKMPQNQELDYSEKRKALLLNSLSLRKFILTSYL
ncbi:MAG: hypothetical protein Q8O95_01200 [bacterium]|nr:hypothetical protein [bacterium]